MKRIAISDKATIKILKMNTLKFNLQTDIGSDWKLYLMNYFEVRFGGVLILQNVLYFDADIQNKM